MADVKQMCCFFAYFRKKTKVLLVAGASGWYTEAKTRKAANPARFRENGLEKGKEESLMLCPQCGKPVEDGAMTCPDCGAPLQQDAQQASTPRYTAAPTPGPVPAGNPQEPPVIQLMRRAARSPAFLVPAIAYTCMVVCNLVAIFQNASPATVDRYVAQLAPYGTNAQLESLSDTLSTALTASVGGSLVGYIPSILVAVGIWMTFASLRDESGAPIKTAGLTIIRVIQIIGLVLFGLAMVLVLILVGTILMMLNAYEDAGTMAGVGVVLALLLGGIVVLAILYSVKTITTIDGFRRSIWTGKPQGKISTYVAVISILGGLLSLTSALTGNVFSALAGVASAVSGVGFGVFLFQYRDWLRSLEQQDTDAPGAYTYNYNAQP